MLKTSEAVMAVVALESQLVALEAARSISEEALRREGKIHAFDEVLDFQKVCVAKWRKKLVACKRRDEQEVSK